MGHIIQIGRGQIVVNGRGSTFEDLNENKDKYDVIISKVNHKKETPRVYVKYETGKGQTFLRRRGHNIHLIHR